MTLTVACLGAGYFARFHHEAWERIDGVAPIAVVDRDLPRAAEVGWPAFPTLEEAFARGVPDILDIATPPETHLAAIRAGLAAGVRLIICQKPFCAGMEEAVAATESAEAAGIPLIVHENFRFQPWYRVMRAALEAGRLGEVHQLTFRLRTGDGQGPRAYLDRQPYFQQMERFLVHETGVHWIDTFRFLLGRPDWVMADLRRMNPVIAGEDAGHVLFGFPGGVRALLDANRHLDHASDTPRRTFGEAELEGTEATITLRGDGGVRLRDHGSQAEDVLLPSRDWPGFAGDCVHALQAHVVAHLREGAPLENTARDYLDVLRIEEAVYRAAETGCRQTL
ncbi:Gfo/Idh/MocA family protein [Pontivivens ytuae]|uniref:Gfo/Idh/MocA family oxidoreductase n=1 Tax=Pontivivens ytuae TaxID=2789856 RepID=A0A7S9QBW2_9RHOB|nr:Gfo/Idh/MocA family oxidoreductase [Pontivivens ytuae]QPH53180.1 Gfo/Idh/MocA family oxidoreductase [Pontivivens ytuae]